MSRQLRVWIRSSDVSHLNEMGWPRQYFLSRNEDISHEPLVEMFISSEEFSIWQNKGKSEVSERNGTGKKLLND